MLFDLHAHFPMHLLVDDEQRTHERARIWWRQRWQGRVVELISRFANYQGPGDMPSVTETLMRDGDVGVVLSVLYQPLDEMDLAESYGAPPRELDTRLAGGLPVLIHAVEGGFQLGRERDEVRRNVATLAGLGVAYVTV